MSNPGLAMKASSSTDERNTTLNRLDPGETAVILDVDTTRSIGRRLLDMGIAPGVRATVVRRAPLGDPIEISLPDMLVSLRSYEAALVSVRLI